MVKREEYLANIRNKLSTFASEIKLNNKVNRQNLNISAEDICCTLLNLIYGYQLVNYNTKRMNQKAIDLVDKNETTAVQITSSNTKRKVSETLKSFYDGPKGRRLCDEFHTLIVLILSAEEKFKGWDEYKIEDLDLQILNFVDLSREVEHFSLNKLEKKSIYLDQELGNVSLYEQAGKMPKHKLPAVPPLSQSFIPGSRDNELENIVSSVVCGEPVYIWGLGGMGKTQVAIELAKRISSTKGVYFLHYALPTSNEKEAMRETIMRAAFSGYHFEESSMEDIQDKQQAAREREEKEYRERLDLLRNEYADAILIIDNFDRPGKTLADLQEESSFNDLLRVGVKLVFTTRCFVGEEKWKIGPISDGALLRLMRKHYRNRDVSDEQLYELIHAVNGHTMTVDLIAKTLEKSWGQIEPSDMLEALRKGDLNREEFRRVVSDHNVTTQDMIYGHLRTLFDLSEMSEADRDVLRYATLLPDEGINARLFMECILDQRLVKMMHEYKNIQDNLQAIYGKRLQAQYARQNALHNLVECGWLNRGEDNIVVIHPVIREICWEELKPNYVNCGLFLDHLWSRYDLSHDGKECVVNISKYFLFANSKLIDAKGKYAFRIETIFDYINSMKQISKLNRYISYQATENESGEQSLAATYNSLGDIYCDLGNYEKALDAKTKSLAILEKMYPSGHLILAKSISSIGLIYRLLNEYDKALEYQHEALKIREKKRSKNRNGLICAYSEIADSYRMICEYEKSLDYQQKALDISERVLIAEHPDLVMLYCNLGRTYSALGNNEKAIEYLNKALTISKVTLLTDKTDTARIYDDIGMTYAAKSEFVRALEYHKKALEIRSYILPVDHPAVADSYDSIGCIYGYMGNYEKSLFYLMEALSLRERILPCTHIDIVDSFNHIGHIYCEMGDVKTAFVYLEVAFVMLKELLSEKHPKVMELKGYIEGLKILNQ